MFVDPIASVNLVCILAIAHQVNIAVMIINVPQNVPHVPLITTARQDNAVVVLQVSMKTRIPNVQSLVWESYVIVIMTAVIPNPVVLEYVRTDVLFVTMIPTAVQAKFVVVFICIVKVIVRNLV